MVGKSVDLHIDWSKRAMGDTAADSTSKREARIQGQTAQFLGSFSFCLLDDGV